MKNILFLLFATLLAFTSCKPDQRAVQSLLKVGYVPVKGDIHMFAKFPSDSSEEVLYAYFGNKDPMNAHKFSVPASAVALDSLPDFSKTIFGGVRLTFSGFVEGVEKTEIWPALEE